MSRPPLLLKDRISGLHYQHNTQTLGFTRTSTSVLAGCVAGVLGLTGLIGFLFYLLSILLSAAVWLYRVDFDAKVATLPAATRDGAVGMCSDCTLTNQCTDLTLLLAVVAVRLSASVRVPALLLSLAQSGYGRADERIDDVHIVLDAHVRRGIYILG